jgi:hypothetical protein
MKKNSPHDLVCPSSHDIEALGGTQAATREKDKGKGTREKDKGQGKREYDGRPAALWT